MYTKIAQPKPFHQGKPQIHAPAIYGAGPGRPVLYRIPATGQRPMTFTADLPEGLTINNEGIITGTAAEGEYPVTITAENPLGKDCCRILFKIAPRAICQTPLLGWTSWNAYATKVSQALILKTAKLLRSTGLAEYGYQYINIDSEWQGAYGGEFDAVQPNEKFPDMKALCDEIHSLGLKCGIYSSPMVRCFGYTNPLPGCTRGELDSEFLGAVRGIAKEHCEENNVRQWCAWGFDYLKYDWRPTDRKNAARMREALDKADRDFALAYTINAIYEHRDFWMNNASSWRDNKDAGDDWNQLKELCFGCDKWLGTSSPGHFFDLDMLEGGYMGLFERFSQLTQDEQLLGYTARVIFPSPIQISCDLEKLTDFDIAMLCNEEVIAVNQDALCKNAICAEEYKTFRKDYIIQTHIKRYEKELADGKTAIAVFNLGNTTETVTLTADNARDLWAKENLTGESGKLTLTLAPHTVRLLKV